MQTFGKTVRNSLPAIGLGLLGALGLASVTLVAAPAAVAQQAPAGIKAKKEFVDNYNAANAALAAKDWQGAIAKADAALPFASDNQQKCVLDQIRTSAYFALKNHVEVIKNGEEAISLGCIQGEQLKNYKQMLAGSYAETGNEAKAFELTKSFIDEYGGSSEQYGFLANKALKAQNNDEAIKYAQKAIDQAAKESKKPDNFYNILLAAYQNSKNMDAFYETLFRVAPVLNNEKYWRPLIARAMQEPKYKKQEAEVDVLHALAATGAQLKQEEQRSLGEQAYIRGSAIEAEQALTPLVQSGFFGGAQDKEADRSKRLFESIKAQAKADKAGGLDQSAKEAASKPTGAVFVSTGEAYYGAGEYAKAADMFQKGIDKGQMEPGATELAKLRLGMAQFKAGQKDAAVKTWSGVTGDNGAAWLAKVWTAYSKV